MQLRRKKDHMKIHLHQDNLVQKITVLQTVLTVMFHKMREAGAEGAMERVTLMRMVSKQLALLELR